MWICLLIRGRKFGKSYIVRTTEPDSVVQYLYGSASLTHWELGFVTVIPVFLRQCLECTDCATVCRFVASTVCQAKVLVKGWKMKQRLEQSTSLAPIERIVQPFWFCILGFGRWPVSDPVTISWRACRHAFCGRNVVLLSTFQ